MNDLLSKFEESLDKLYKKDKIEQQYVKLKDEINTTKLKENNLENELNILKVKLKEAEETLQRTTDKDEIKNVQKDLKNINKQIQVSSENMKKTSEYLTKLKTLLLEKEELLNQKYSKIINNKSQVIEELREYQIKWNEWLDENFKNINLTKLRKENYKEKKIIEKIFNSKNILLKEKSKIQKALLQIKNEILKTIEDKNIYIIKKENIIQKRNEEYIELKKIQEQKNLPEKIDNKDEEKVKELLLDNENALRKPLDEVQYTKNLVNISNIFWRNSKIIEILDKYFKENVDKNELFKVFKKVKQNIQQIMKFIDIKKFNNIIKTKYKLCDEEISNIEIITKYWDENKHKFFTQIVTLTNIYEYLFNKVRIVIKTNYLEVNEEDKISISCKLNENEQEKLYIDKKNIYEIYGLEWMPQNIFNGFLKENFNEYELSNKKNIQDVVKLLKSGFSTTFLNIGNSHDKSMFVNGNLWNRGLFSYISEFVQNENGLIKIVDVWELYNYSIDLENGKMSSRINLNTKSKQLKTLFNKHIYNYKEPIDNKTLDLESYYKNRKDTFLFIHLQCNFKDVKTNLVIIDVPDFYTPDQLFKKYFPDKITLENIMYTDELKYIKLYNKTDEEPEVILNKLKNSYYITEVINHLKYYFKRLNTDERLKINYNMGLERYSTNNFFIDPYSEYKNKIDEKNNCLILPLMNYVNEIISNKNKYILLSVLNQNDYQETKNIIKFIKDIS